MFRKTKVLCKTTTSHEAQKTSHFWHWLAHKVLQIERGADFKLPWMQKWLAPPPLTLTLRTKVNMCAAK
jgi:hypothetical protein